jgi:hypothetical protein
LFLIQFININFQFRILLKTFLFFFFVNQSIGSIVIYCYYNNYYYGYIGSFYAREKYTCDGVIDVIDDGSRDVSMIYGSHIAKKTSSSVEFLRVTNEIFTSVPPNLNIFFPNLLGIIIDNSNLIHLSSDDLKSFYNLTVFKATGNPLESIDGDLFRYHPSLTHVDFSSNKIREVGENLFITSAKLTNAYFAKNLCIDENAKNPIEVLRLNIKLPRLCPKQSASSTSAVEMPIETSENV